VRLQGGIGNQLYQYACGRAVALRLGRQLLYDDRTIANEAHCPSYCLGDFETEIAPVSGYAAWCVRWIGSIRLGAAFRKAWPPARRYRYLRDRETGFDASVFEDAAGPIVLHGYWQSFLYFAGIEDVLRRELAFRCVPDAANADLAREIASCQSVGLHIRRGDYVASPFFNATLGTPEPDYHRAAAEFMISRLGGAPTFFVFSDDPAWVRENLRLPGPMKVVDLNQGRAAIDDLRLMSACRNFITANSSFSWWGAWLGAHKSGLVVCPRRWFVRDGTPPEERIPANWCRL